MHAPSGAKTAGRESTCDSTFFKELIKTNKMVAVLCQVLEIKCVSKVLGHLSKPAALTSVPGLLRHILHILDSPDELRIEAAEASQTNKIFTWNMLDSSSNTDQPITTFKTDLAQEVPNIIQQSSSVVQIHLPKMFFEIYSVE